MRQVLKDWYGGVSVGGRRILNLRYAEYTAFIAVGENELADLINLEESSEPRTETLH